jgi:hypothetical protein
MRGCAAGPCDARAGLDAKHAPTGYVRRTRSRVRHDRVIKVTVQRLVSDLAFGLLGTNASTQTFDIRHVAREAVLVGGHGFPVRYLDVCAHAQY